MATSNKSVARNEPTNTSEDDTRDTLHDVSLETQYATTIPAASAEKSRVRLRTHALVEQSMHWYGGPAPLPIREIPAEKKIKSKTYKP